MKAGLLFYLRMVLRGHRDADGLILRVLVPGKAGLLLQGCGNTCLTTPGLIVC
ncbi:MAG: hypothetical protein BWY09_01440 [Candidatus Hydrogenedentes bacterium ADurb.Bin179]|nr:MAG: hypothetical protein BWY09_01440 [Candidatus Hydrogenedentes bacterium ADurb.Bin179]